MGTARFWVWHNGGWVKLSLREGESLQAVSYRETDEGFCSEWCTWTFEPADHPFAALVRQEYGTRSRDCDGLHEFYSEMVCRKDWLKYSQSEDSADVFVPNWESVSKSCRDHAAEAMGY